MIPGGSDTVVGFAGGVNSESEGVSNFVTSKLVVSLPEPSVVETFSNTPVSLSTQYWAEPLSVPPSAAPAAPGRSLAEKLTHDADRPTIVVSDLWP